MSDLGNKPKLSLLGKGRIKDNSLFLAMKNAKISLFKEPEIVIPNPTAADKRIHVRYYFFNEKTKKYKRFKVYDTINQEKTHAKKLKHADDVAKFCTFIFSQSIDIFQRFV